MGERREAHLGMEPENTLVCRNCGDRYQLPMPMPVWLFTAAIDGWRKGHKSCRPDPEVAKRDAERLRASFADPFAWLAGPDTGLSSKTIWHVMMGRPYDRASIPMDPSDFGRCYRLLKAFPEWRARLHEVAERHPAWTPLVAAWAELEALHDEEEPRGRAPKLYKRMQELSR